MTHWPLIDVGQDPGLQPHPLAPDVLVSTTPGKRRLVLAEQWIMLRGDTVTMRPSDAPALSHRFLGDGEVLVLAEAIVYRHAGTLPGTEAPWVTFRVEPCSTCSHRHHYALAHFLRSPCVACRCERWSSDLLR